MGATDEFNDRARAAFQSFIDEAWNDGFRAGRKVAAHEALGRMMASVQEMVEDDAPIGIANKLAELVSTNRNVPNVGGASARTIEAAAEEARESVKRAPRGSVEHVLNSALRANPSGLTPEQIVFYGSTVEKIEVSIGSVKNRLREYEQDKKVRSTMGAWFLVSQPQTAAPEEDDLSDIPDEPEEDAGSEPKPEDPFNASWERQTDESEV